MYPTTRRNYTNEFKIQAVALAETLGRTEAARQLEMSVKTLDNWVNASRNGQPLSSPDRRAITREDSELARLRAENAELKLEREILKKGGGILCQRVQVRYAFVAEERAQFPVRLLCRVMGVSVSGFYDYQHRQGRPDPDAQIRIDLHRVYAASRKTYGRPRLVEALRQQAYAIGHKRVDRLMHEEHIQGRSKGGFRPCTTDSHHALPVASNLLDRQFSIQSSTPAWVSDITYIATKEGWLYLAVVLSIQTRQVLGYSLADRMPDDLVERAFMNAWSACLGAYGVIFHSDQGRQYASSRFRLALAKKGFAQSMSRRGNCWDNAVAESFFATLKREEACAVYPTKKQAHLAIASYIHGFYNSCRLHSALGYRSPNEYAKGLRQLAL